MTVKSSGPSENQEEGRFRRKGEERQDSQPIRKGKMFLQAFCVSVQCAIFFFLFWVKFDIIELKLILSSDVGSCFHVQC